MKKNFYTLKDSSIAFFLCLVSMLGASFLLSFLVGVISALKGVDVEVVQKYDSVSYLNMFLSTIIFLLIFLGVSYKSKTNFFTAGKIKTKFSFILALGAVGLAIIVFLGGLNITNLYNHLFTNVFPPQVATQTNTSNFGIFLLQVLLLGLLPSVFEELVFRGIIYNGLRQKFSAILSIIFSALLFALIHLSIYKSFYQIILGLILGFLVYYTGSIIYGMIFHFTNNFIILLLLYIFPNGSIFELVKGGELATAVWGTKEVLLAILFFIVAIGLVVLIFYLIRKYTFKHKNYFNLEKTKNPLNNYLEENNENLLQENNKQKNKTDIARLWYLLGIIGFSFFWIVNSCGVTL